MSAVPRLERLRRSTAQNAYPPPSGAIANAGADLPIQSPKLRPPNCTRDVVLSAIERAKLTEEHAAQVRVGDKHSKHCLEANTPHDNRRQLESRTAVLRNNDGSVGQFDLPPAIARIKGGSRAATRSKRRSRMRRMH
jgi:hypothetical protein